MLRTIKNAWKVPDIRKKILFVLFILLLVRVGTLIPVPFVDHEAMQGQGGALTGFGGIFSYLNLLSGGALSQGTLFALGVTPYINASIIIQLLSVAVPAMERWSHEGEEGKKKINSVTRVVTIILAIVTALGYYFILKRGNGVNSYLVDDAVNGNLSWFYGIVIVACFCAGASLVMWLAEKINENGLGNGISLILFVNIIAALPTMVTNLVGLFIDSSTPGAYIWSSVLTVALVGVLIALTIFIIFITGSERRIPIQYAKRTVGRKMYGGQSSNLPIKLNMSGVMPVIFASSICTIIPTILMFCGVTASANTTTPNFLNYFYDFCNVDGWFYSVMLFILIIAFSYFYITISFNPVEISNNLKKNGGMIPGIRQGQPTSDFISKVLSKITFAGAIFLGIVALLPIILKAILVTPAIAQIYQLSGDGYIMAQQLASSFTFGGTSILIAVGVIQETQRELESQLTMRNYKGFLN